MSVVGAPEMGKLWNVSRSDGSTVWWHLTLDVADQKSKWLNANMAQNYAVVDAFEHCMNRGSCGLSRCDAFPGQCRPASHNLRPDS